MIPAPPNINQAQSDVLQDIAALRSIGVDVPKLAVTYILAHPADIEQLRSTMKVHEITDLVIQLSSTGILFPLAD